MKIMTNRIIYGNASDVLKQFPSEFINCVVTSSPYWGLRDYGDGVECIWDGEERCEHEWNLVKEKDPMDRGGSGDHDFGGISASWEKRERLSGFCLKCGAWKGQLGLEPDFNLFIKHLLDIFDEVKRVLKKDGTCWVVLADTYSGSGCGTNDYRTEASKSIQGIGKNARLYKTGGIAQRIKEVPAKCLCGIPERFMLGMIKRGWILRNKIIWHKPNCMPASVKDRFTVDFEYVFFFVKNKRYWFETQYEPLSKAYLKEKRPFGVLRQRLYENSKYVKHEYGNKQFKGKATKEWLKKWQKNEDSIHGQNAYSPQGRNKRCVWTITTKPFKEAHFAVYPEQLIETPIKAGCPKNGIVLDPFCGSGTTLLVAKKLKRNYIGIDINPEYVKMAKKRINAYSVVHHKVKSERRRDEKANYAKR